MLRGFVIGVFLIVLLQLAAGTTALFVLGEHKVWTYHRLYSRIPVIFMESYFYDAIGKKEGTEAIQLLRRQNKIANLLGMNGFMKRDLVQNTYRWYESLETRSEFIIFDEWLGELKSSLGVDYGNYWLELVTSRTKARIEPEFAVSRMTNIRDQLPGHAAAYREVVKSALISRQSKVIKLWCSKFAQWPFVTITSTPDYYYKPSQQNNSLMLYIENNNEVESISSDPLYVGRQQPYEFYYPEAPAQKYLTLKYRVFPGTILTFKSVSFINGKNEKVTYKVDDVSMTSDQGFFVDQGTLVMVSQYKSDTVVVVPNQGSFPTSDRIVFDVHVDRLKLATHSSCM